LRLPADRIAGEFRISSNERMWEQGGIALVASIFTFTTAAALWSGQFNYRFGPTIHRRDRPVEYWSVTLLFLGITCLIWTILLLVATGQLTKWQG
jgi:hypothetical protein